MYFDAAATTPLHRDVVALWNQLAPYYGNASTTYQAGREAKRLLEEARCSVQDLIHAQDAHEIIFNSGATEGNNSIIMQTALSHLNEPAHFITSTIEHPSVLATYQYLETLGFSVTYLPVNHEGLVQLDQVQQALRPETKLVSLMMVNNEMGACLPISTIGAYLATQADCYFHVDAVQALGHVPINVEAQKIDYLTLSAHKFQGPKGLGVCYVRRSAPFQAYLHGGLQEGTRRAGTEDVIACQLGALAGRLALSDQAKHQKLYERLGQELLQGLDRAGVAYEINGPSQANRSPHIINLWLKGKLASRVLIRCDLAGIALSAGSACSAGSLKPSHVLQALYPGEDQRHLESVRISFYPGNQVSDIEQLVTAIKNT